MVHLHSLAPVRRLACTATVCGLFACGGEDLSLGELPSTKTNTNTCVAVAATPTSVGKLQGEPLRDSLTAAGASLFVGIETEPAPAARAKLLELAAGRPAKDVVLNDFAGGVIFADANRIVFKKAAPSSPTEYVNVVVQNRADGQVRTLPNPAGDFVMDVAVTRSGDVYWVTGDDESRRWVVHSDGTAAPPTIVAEGRFVTLQTDGEEVYYRTAVAEGLGIFRARGGSAPVEVWRASDLGHLLAVDETRIFLASGGGHGLATLQAMPKAGGEPILLEEDFNISTRLITDDTHVYWSTVDSVVRMPKAGGQKETVVAEPGGLQAFTVDACNVYWTRRSPSEVMARAK